jgi:hypothetical protein
MPESTFESGTGAQSFKISHFVSFADSCRQTLVLYERASSAGSCVTPSDDVSSALQSRVDTVNQACCEEDGVNICTSGGPPTTCDAVCTLRHYM